MAAKKEYCRAIVAKQVLYIQYYVHFISMIYCISTILALLSCLFELHQLSSHETVQQPPCGAEPAQISSCDEPPDIPPMVVTGESNSVILSVLTEEPSRTALINENQCKCELISQSTIYILHKFESTYIRYRQQGPFGNP